MVVHRFPKKSFAVLLVASAAGVGTQLGGAVPAVATGPQGASGGSSQGVPPVLRRATAFELDVIRQAEALKAAAAAYDPPATAKYSLAGLNGYATAFR